MTVRAEGEDFVARMEMPGRAKSERGRLSDLTRLGCEPVLTVHTFAFR